MNEKQDPKTTAKKPEIPFTPFTEPACEVRDGKRIAPTAKVYEAHDYNRKLLESQRARGVPANIPKVPLAKTHVTAINKPKLIDLVAKAQAMKAAQAALAASLEGGSMDVLPDEGIQFDELG